MRFFHTFTGLSLLVAAWGQDTAHATDPRTEWWYYGQDPGGARYVSLKQIDTQNVSLMERAWTYRTGDIARGGAHYAECTPLVVDGVMYVITPFSKLIAIDAVTGAELWRFSPDPPLSERETGAGGLASRGVAYWHADGMRRIFLPVRDGRIYSIDPGTQEPDPAFGTDGHINLRAGLPKDGDYLFLSSPPAVYEDVLVQPYGIDDTSSERNHYVPLRAYDVRSGALRWTFHTIPRPGEFGHDTWAGDSWKHRSGTNPWAALSVDTERGIFYAAIGAPNSDKYGGDRHGDNLFSNAIVALDARSGERRWHFQTVHHDLWDYDLPAMPNLVDLTVAGDNVPAVAVVGKTGFVYLFNRETGEPVFPIEERSVPASDVPGELAAPTQPFPSKPPPFARQYLEASGLDNRDDRVNAGLRKDLAEYRSEGIFTPPSKQGSVVLPGQLGGANWSGASVTPEGMMYVTANELPYVSVVKELRGPFGAKPAAGHFRGRDGHPAIAPPWGTLTKLDLGRGELVWQIALGDFEDVQLEDEASGQLNFGGATATAGGVVFAAGTMDAKLRAFDAETGNVLFESQLEAAGYGAPISYLGTDNRQYVAIFAGGGGKAGSEPGDYVIAFRLPR